MKILYPTEIVQEVQKQEVNNIVETKVADNQ